LPVAAVAFAADDAVVGDWEGMISGGGGSIRIIFHIMAGEDGALTATLDSPDQGASGVPFTSVEYADGTLKLVLAAAQASYEGTLTEDGTLAGTWSQGGGAIELNMSRQ
jgi:hypothetical protein